MPNAALPVRGPNRVGLIGMDHIESLGGQEMYVQRMLSHQRQLAAVQPIMRLDKPVAAFSGGTRRTPRPVARPTHRRDEFNEVREAWRRIIVSRPSVDSNRQPKWKDELATAEKISRELKRITTHTAQSVH